MMFKVKKTLGAVALVSVDRTSNGVNILFNQYGAGGASITIYTDSEVKDLHLNGWTIPCVYHINLLCGLSGDIWGGKYRMEVSFDVLDKNGDVHRVEKKPLYGVQDIEAMTYFYTMLYYLSCCDDFDQFQKLYSYVVDNDDFDGNYPSRDPIEVMAFIDNFANTLKNVSDLSFADGLKRLLSKRYKRAQELIASKPNPIN